MSISYVHTIYSYSYKLYSCIQFVAVALTSYCILGNTFADTSVDSFAEKVVLKSKNACLVLFITLYCGYPWMLVSIKIIFQLLQVAGYSYKYENCAELQ